VSYDLRARCANGSATTEQPPVSRISTKHTFDGRG
jgi:hypothetical protein